MKSAEVQGSRSSLSVTTMREAAITPQQVVDPLSASLDEGPASDSQHADRLGARHTSSLTGALRSQPSADAATRSSPTAPKPRYGVFNDVRITPVRGLRHTDAHALNAMPVL